MSLYNSLNNCPFFTFLHSDSAWFYRVLTVAECGSSPDTDHTETVTLPLTRPQSTFNFVFYHTYLDSDSEWLINSILFTGLLDWLSRLFTTNLFLK